MSSTLYIRMVIPWCHMIDETNSKWSSWNQTAINNNPSLIQVMAWVQTGAKPLTKPTCHSSLMHLCIIRSNNLKWIGEISKTNIRIKLRVSNFWRPGVCLNINVLSCQYRNPLYKDKTLSWLPYLYDDNVCEFNLYIETGPWCQSHPQVWWTYSQQVPSTEALGEDQRLGTLPGGSHVTSRWPHLVEVIQGNEQRDHRWYRMLNSHRLVAAGLFQWVSARKT